AASPAPRSRTTSRTRPRRRQRRHRRRVISHVALTLRRSPISVAPLQARGEALGPEILRAERHQRPRLADEAADAGHVVGDLRAVDGAIDLLAGADDVADPQAVVADPGAEVGIDVDAELEADLGGDGELALAMLADVGGQGEDAGGLRVGDAGRDQ